MECFCCLFINVISSSLVDSGAGQCLRALQAMCSGREANRREAVRSLLCDTIMRNIVCCHAAVLAFVGDNEGQVTVLLTFLSN